MSLANSPSDEGTTEVSTDKIEMFDSWEAFEEYDKSIPYSYRDERVLQYLYHREGWTQEMIADRYDVHRKTISRWMSENGIKTGYKCGQGSLTFHSIGSGNDIAYPRFRSQGGDITESIRIHKLLACLDNDPHEVFKEGNHVHHRLNSPVATNIPGNLENLDQSDHRTEHRAIDRLTEEENADRVEKVLNKVLDG
jgi:hypothetical protein